MTEVLVGKSNHFKDDDVSLKDDGFQFPEDNDVSDMLDEVPLNEELPSVTDRYFTPYYRINVQKPCDDICVRIHSNRICMLTLAPSHPLLQKDSKIQSISFKVTEKLDRTANKVSGKGKHGAQLLQESSNICIITCADETRWNIKCCINGKLIEVNETLVDNPELIREPPHKGGYLAIVIPNLKNYESMKQSLMTKEEYQKVLRERLESTDKFDHSSNSSTTAKRALVDQENSNVCKKKIKKI